MGKEDPQYTRPYKNYEGDSMSDVWPKYESMKRKYDIAREDEYNNLNQVSLEKLRFANPDVGTWPLLELHKLNSGKHIDLEILKNRREGKRQRKLKQRDLKKQYLRQKQIGQDQSIQKKRQERLRKKYAREQHERFTSRLTHWRKAWNTVSAGYNNFDYLNRRFMHDTDWMDKIVERCYDVVRFFFKCEDSP